MKYQKQRITKLFRLLASQASDDVKARYIINRHQELPDGVRPRVLISTMPKSGTYLLSEIVKELGFHQTYYHLCRHKLQSYEPTLLEQGRLHPRDFDVFLPIEQSNRLIRSGEFAASHLEPDVLVCECFSDFKVVSCIRELRSALRSYARFVVESAGRDGTRKIRQQKIIETHGFAGWIETIGPENLQKAKKIFSWKDRSNAILVRMEDLLRCPELVIRNIADHLNEDVTIDFDVVKGRDTLTKSTNLSADLNWDDDAEAAFRKIGGIEVNQLLGYE